MPEHHNALQSIDPYWQTAPFTAQDPGSLFDFLARAELKLRMDSNEFFFRLCELFIRAEGNETGRTPATKSLKETKS